MLLSITIYMSSHKFVVDGGLSIPQNTSLELQGTDLTASGAELNKLDGVSVTGTELDYNAGITLGTAAASKVMSWASDSTWTAAGGTCANLGSITTVDINGGSIDGMTIATSDVTVGSGKTLDVSDGTFTLADNQISGDKVEGGTIASITISSLDMNGGTINGATVAESDVTVGAGKTLDVSAGTLTVADDQISGDKVEGGEIDAITINTMSGGLDSDVTATTQAASDDSTKVATTSFVQSLVGGSDLDFTVDGTSYDLDLDSQSIALSGTENEIQITDSEANGVISMQIGLPSTVGIDQVTVGDGTNKSFNDTTQDAHMFISGSSYTGFLAMDGTSMHIGHNSAARALDLKTDETTRLRVSGAGDIAVYNSLDLEGHDGTAGLKLNGVLVTASAAELNDLAGNNVAASDFTKLASVTATAAELNYLDNEDLTAADLTKLAAITATAAEINDLTSNNVDGSDFTKLSEVTATSTELNYLDGVSVGTAVVDTALVMSAAGPGGVSKFTFPATTELDVSAGTFTLADDQISGNKVEGGTINAITINTMSGELADGVVATTQTGTDNSTKVATTAFVQGLVGGSDLDFKIGDDTFALELDSERLDYAGTANEIELSSSEEANGNVTMTIGLPDNVTIGDALTVTGETTHNDKVNMGTNNIEGSADDMLIQSGTVVDASWSNGDGHMAIQAENEMIIESAVRKNSDFAVTADGSAQQIFSFAGSSFHSAKVHVRISDGSDVTAKEVLVVCDASGANPKFVEYATVNSAASEMSNTWTVSAAAGTVSVNCQGSNGDTIKGSFELLKA